MGAGALVLANGVPYNREVLEDSGLFWSPQQGDLPALIRDVEADLARAQSLRVAARARAAEHYDWDVIADGYADYFTTLAGRAAATRETELAPAA
jgi:glycosyltransferase involved in cell wall biosynthesis